MRFCTKSLRYSTDVPGPSAGLPAPPKLEPGTVSECNDWASHSRASGVVTVGVLALPAAAKERPVADDTVPVPMFMGAGTDGFVVLDLKEERRFCAEDFLRIVGRGWSTVKWDILCDLKD